MRFCLRGLLATLLLTLPFAGCKQGENERCQLTSDCVTGFVCVLPTGGSPQQGGTCQLMGGTPSQNDLSTPSQDLATPAADMATAAPDLATAAPDLTSTPDLTTPPDLAGVD